MSTLSIVNLSLEIWGSIMSIVIIFCIYYTNRIKRKSDRIFLALLLLNLSSMAFDIVNILYEGKRDPMTPGIMMLANVMTFLCITGLCSIYIWFLEVFFERKMKRKPFPEYQAVSYALLFFEVVLLAGNLFCPYLFYIDEANRYVRGFLYPLIYLPAIICGGVCIWMMQTFRSYMEPWERVFFYTHQLLPIGVMLITLVYRGVVFGYAGMTTALIILFVYLQEENGRRAAEQENELLESRMAMMVSQIQPHFMFNALNSIEYLCDIDSPDSGKAVNQFAKYLRENMDSVFVKNCIPFRQELSHTEHYLYIEKLRFPEIEIRYELEERDFKLPPITLQPMVENAIKHGVRGMGRKACIVISTQRVKDFILLTIEDNGRGFEAEKVLEDGHTHVGIKNTRKRLELMCAGELRIESRVGEGTKVMIYIPEEGNRLREETVKSAAEETEEGV